MRAKIFTSLILAVTVLSSCIHELATNNLRVIDFRNADLLGGLGLQPNRVYVREIYTHPSNTYVTAMVTQLISETSVSDGILWLHASNPDAATMRAAAEAKGWTVYDL